MLLDDLPEELVRNIFEYFTDADVYFKLRYICRKIHKYAEGYVELGKLNVYVIVKPLNRIIPSVLCKRDISSLIIFLLQERKYGLQEILTQLIGRS